MVIKNCIICGKEFNCTGRELTCCDEHEKQHKKEKKSEYYNTHREQWRWYRANNDSEDLGTTNISSKICRKEDGTPDWKAEELMIKAALKDVGLIYEE